MVAVVSVWATCAALAPPAAAIAELACGSVVTADATLQQDLRCDSEPAGLSIGADGVTLDLDGHTVSGGIVNHGYDHVTIRNGAVSDEDLALTLEGGADGNRLENLTGGSLGVPFRVDGADNLTVQSVEAHAYDDWSFQLRNATHAHMADVSGTGVSLAGVFDSVLTDSDLSGYGIWVSAGARNKIIYNHSASYYNRALNIHSGRDHEVIGNTLYNSYNGVAVWADAVGTRVAHNLVHSSGDGIFVHDGAQRSVVEYNTSWNNFDFYHQAGHGLRIDSSSTTVRGNTAYSNAGWGIHAVSGVIDGGANSAYDNVMGQCTAPIVCVGATVGTQVAGDVWTTATANTKVASRFSVDTDVLATRVHAYVDGNGGKRGNQQLRAVVYSDDGGTAGHLLAASRRVHVKAGKRAGWVAFALPARLALSTESNYWLGLHSGKKSGVTRWATTATSSSATSRNGDDFRDGPSRTFGTESTRPGNLSIFATG